MPRLLLIAALLAVVVATTAGMAWAHEGASGAARAAVRDPLSVPRAVPRADADQPGVASYRPTAEIAAAVEAASAATQPSATPTPAPGSASITVTAVVLPTITLQLADDGAVASIISNTPDRDAASVVYAARDAAGASRPLTRAMWKSARAALAEADAGVGTIWSR